MDRRSVDAGEIRLFRGRRRGRASSNRTSRAPSASTAAATSGTPRAGQGAVAAKLGTTKRTDGTLQVRYDGHPLYTYAGDSNPAQTNGEGLDQFGAEWYVLSPAGQAVENGGS